MDRHYSTRDFFRQMPNALLARYFAARGVLAEMNFAALKEAKPEPLFAAWLELPEGQRNATRRPTPPCGKMSHFAPCKPRFSPL
jgi:hypothetical protein